ncbi:MAG: hypothetical protein LQ351_003225 [Letrouitia transgressa]|nr:MAG: hypothetical protein LQ351_003225 [Letrouitia transgressa]
MIDSIICSELRDALNDVVLSPEVQGFTLALQSYWAQQEQLLTPSCVVQPRSATEVSTIIRTIVRFNAKARVGNGIPCRFAVKGGGHGHVVGVANIRNGVTIDMGAMKAIAVNRGNTLTSVGAGAKWLDIYNKLDTLGLSVVGGRLSGIGVGGLITGGGMSFFSPLFGFACDQVDNYEVVLASGQIVNANARENPDLWVALKGGSSNFGIITRFDLKTFRTNGIWGGTVVQPVQTLPQQISAFVSFNNASDYDPYASVINTYVYSRQNGWLVSNILVYTKPQAFPPALEPFTVIEPKILNTVDVRNLKSMTLELNQFSPPGARQLFVTRTYGNDPDLLKEIFAAANITLQTIASVPGLQYEVVFQPLPSVITSRGAATGGNVLGLDPAAGPLVIAEQGISWTNAADDEAIASAAKAVFDKVDQIAEQRGLLHDWIYLNYASEWQDPIASYGRINVLKLQAASSKYDPEGVFQSVMPGGFKLFAKNDTGTTP